jgi:hypothetical protein
MADMFEDFDPYVELMLMKDQLDQQQAMINTLIVAHNSQAKLVHEISVQIKRMSEIHTHMQTGVLQIMERIEQLQNETKPTTA